MVEEKKEMEQKKEQKILQLSLIDNKLQELEQQSALVEKQINELQLCILALDELKEAKPNSEMLAPISPDVFVKTQLKDNKEVIMNMGAKIFCKKSLPEAKKFIEQKLNQTIEVYNKITSEMNQLAEAMIVLEKEIKEN